MATIAQIKGLLELAPEYYNGSGLRWKVSRGTAKAGSMAGTLNKDGYYQVKVFGKLYQSHQIVGLLANIPNITLVRSSIKCGKLQYVVDHIDTNKTNNSPDNLRVITNKANTTRAKSNRTGHTNVKLTKYGKYQVVIRNRYIGSYSTLEQALEERDKILQQSS